MFSLKKSLLVSFFLMGVFSMSYAIAEEIPNKFFYENPTFQEFETEANGCIENNKEYLDICRVFITGTLKKYPDFSKSILEKFKQYSDPEKVIYAEGLLYINKDKELAKLSYNLKSSGSKPMTIEDVDRINLQVLNNGKTIAEIPKNADYLWSAFKVTGDDKYLISMLHYLTSESDKVKTLSFELKNRIQLAESNQYLSEGKDPKKLFEDLQKAIETESKKDPFIRDRIVSYNAVLTAMEIQRKNFPSLEKKVQALIRKDPKLDYRAGVKL